MAEEASEVLHPIEGGETESAQDMEVEAGSVEKPVDSGADEQPNGRRKRGREEGGDAAETEAEAEEGENGASKMQKVVTSVEEERIEKQEEKKEGEEEPKEGEEEKEEEGEGGGRDDGEGNGDVTLGPKVFSTSVEMFDYLYKFLHFWAHNLDINKYEHMVLLDLLKKGHAEADRKIGRGIQAFQVRYHPKFKSRCFFLVRVDGTSDDFSFRKCIDHILPLPENLKTFEGKKGGGDGGRGGQGGQGGRGNGGRWGRGGRGGRGRGGRGRR